MKAIVIKSRYGLDNIELEDITIPKPGADEVLVKVGAIALNQLDIMIASGVFKNELPHILGSDAAGVVTAVGNAVSNFKPGDKVVTHFIKDWDKGAITQYARDKRLGVGSEGVFAQYIALPETAFVKIPSNLDEIQAATLPIAALTAWHSLAVATKLTAGETVFLQGTGGVSIFALQFAKALGAKVVLSSGSDKKLEQARALGADFTVNYKTNPDWEQEVLHFTEGNGADVAVEISWKDVNKTFTAMKIGGRVAIVGLIGGSEARVNAHDLIGKNLVVYGMQVGSREIFQDMIRAIETHNIQPVIDKVFPLSEYRDAFDYLKKGQHFGKVVVTF